MRMMALGPRVLWLYIYMLCIQLYYIILIIIYIHKLYYYMYVHCVKMTDDEVDDNDGGSSHVDHCMAAHYKPLPTHTEPICHLTMAKNVITLCALLGWQAGLWCYIINIIVIMIKALLKYIFLVFCSAWVIMLEDCMTVCDVELTTLAGLVASFKLYDQAHQAQHNGEYSHCFLSLSTLAMKRWSLFSSCNTQSNLLFVYLGFTNLSW